MEPALRNAMPIMKRIIPLLLGGWMSACINVPEIEPGGGEPPPTDAGEPEPEPPSKDLTVHITSPAQTAYSNSSVPITIEVREGKADLVQVLKNGQILSILRTPPYQYTWDTTKEAEGSYKLTARAFLEGTGFTSAPVTVVVDRTNLQVASRTPADGSRNVDYQAPVQVVFTKPVKPETLNDTTVSVKVAGNPVEKTLSLSSDGKTLTITPKEKPVFPATFSFGLSRGITDIAGNALNVPISPTTTPWNFEVPSWYSFGDRLEAIRGVETPMKDVAMVLDKDGNPIVAWTEETLLKRYSIFVFRWDGKTFVHMGGPLNGTATGSAFKTALALGDDGNPVVAWEESDGRNENIHVMRWRQNTWQVVGTGALSAENDPQTPTPAHNPSLAVKDNDIYVAWDEIDNTQVSNIQVWKSIDGGPFFGLGNTRGRVNAVPGATNGLRPSLVLDSNGQAIVAFQERTLKTGNPFHAYVMRLNNNNWDYAVPPFQGDTPTGHIAGGLSVGTNSDPWLQDCSLGLTKSDQLYLAWSEESSPDNHSQIQIFESTGTQSWKQLGKELSANGQNSPAVNSNIKISNTGKLFITWRERYWMPPDYTPALSLQVGTWEERNWKILSSIHSTQNKEGNTVSTTLELDKSDRPTIAWIERERAPSGTGSCIYVRRKN